MVEDEKVDTYLDEQAKMLSEITEISEEEILSDLTNKMAEGFKSPQGAVMHWKSEHKRQLGVGESRDFKIRVIGKGLPRQGNYGDYAYMEFLVQDDGLLETKTCSFSSGSLPKMDLLHLDGTYEVRAFEKPDGSLNRLRAVNEIEDDKIPRVDQLSAYDFPFPNLGDLEEFDGTTKLLHGWVGRIIRSKLSGEVIGFEFGDDSTLVPLTVWVNFVPQELKDLVQDIQEGDEAYLCGYIQSKEDSYTVNGKGVFKVE